MGVSQNSSGLKRDGPLLAIALKVLTRRLLRRGARYRKQDKTIELPTQACFVLALGSGAVHTQIKSVNGLNIEAKRYFVAPNDSFFK